MENTRDTSHWAKKFDTVKHIYSKDGSGTVCGSVAHCLGNNYATKSMDVCTKCELISNPQTDKK